MLGTDNLVCILLIVVFIVRRVVRVVGVRFRVRVNGIIETETWWALAMTQSTRRRRDAAAALAFWADKGRTPHWARHWSIELGGGDADSAPSDCRWAASQKLVRSLDGVGIVQVADKQVNALEGRVAKRM